MDKPEAYIRSSPSEAVIKGLFTVPLCGSRGPGFSLPTRSVYLEETDLEGKGNESDFIEWLQVIDECTTDPTHPTVGWGDPRARTASLQVDTPA